MQACSRAVRPTVLALAALFAAPALAHPSSGIVVDRKGQVFFSDNGGAGGFLWKVDAEGKLTRCQEHGWHWIALDEKGNYTGEDLKKWFEKRITMNFHRVPLPDSGGALLQADGAPVVVDREGNLCWARGNVELARLKPDGQVTLVAPGLKETTEKLGGIKGLASGPDGSLYAACPSAVLRIKPGETVTTLVHPVVLDDADMDLPRGTPEDHKPYLRGLAVDTLGMVYAAATGGRRVAKITPEGKVEVILRSEPPWSPTGVAVRGEEVYVLEYQNPNGDDHAKWVPRVRKLGRDGNAKTIATVPETAQAGPRR